MEGTGREREREIEDERSKTVRGKKSPLLGTIKLAGEAAAVQRGTFLSNLSLSLSLCLSVCLSVFLVAFPLISSVFLWILLDSSGPSPRACLLSAMIRVLARLLRRQKERFNFLSPIRRDLLAITLIQITWPDHGKVDNAPVISREARPPAIKRPVNRCGHGPCSSRACLRAYRCTLHQ